MDIKFLRKLIREAIIAEKELDLKYYTLADKLKRKTGKTWRAINRGGCGFFATLMYYELRKHFGITPKLTLLYIGDDPQALESNIEEINRQKTLNDLHDLGIASFVHIVLHIPGTKYYLDSAGIHTLQDLTKDYSGLFGTNVLEGISVTALNRWVRDSNGWNSEFGRFNIPRIVKEVDVIMDELEQLDKLNDQSLSKIAKSKKYAK